MLLPFCIFFTVIVSFRSRYARVPELTPSLCCLKVPLSKFSASDPTVSCGGMVFFSDSGCPLTSSLLLAGAGGYREDKSSLSGSHWDPKGGCAVADAASFPGSSWLSMISTMTGSCRHDDA